MYQSTNRKANIFNIDFIKNILPLVIILPSLIGGIMQIISLSLIDVTYVKFFSSAQVIQDSLMVLSFLLIVIVVYLILIEVVSLFNSKYIRLIRLLIVFSSLVVIIKFHDYINNDLLQLICMGYAVSSIFIHIKLRLITDIPYLYGKNSRLYLFAHCLILLFFCIGVLLDIQERQYKKLSSNNINFIELESKLLIKYRINPNTKLVLKYFNQNYIFYEVKNEKNNLDNKIIIAKFSELLGEDKKEK